MPALALFVTIADQNNKNFPFIKDIISQYFLYFCHNQSILDSFNFLNQIAELLQSTTQNLQYVSWLDFVQNLHVCITTQCKHYSAHCSISKNRATVSESIALPDDETVNGWTIFKMHFLFRAKEGDCVTSNNILFMTV